MKETYISITIMAMLACAISFFSGSIVLFFTFLFVMILSIVMTNVQANKDRKQNLKNATHTINELLKEHNIIKSHFYLNHDHTQAVVADEHNNIIAIFRKSEESFNILKYNFLDIIESEIIQDGNTITKTSKGSAVGGALVGGILAGGVGALIGGISAKSRSYEEFKKIQLQITFNDTYSPIHSIEFMNSEYEIDKDSSYYKKTYEDILHWHKLLSVLIKRQQSNKDVSNH